MTVITKATACIPETFLGKRLSSIEKDKMVETADMFDKELTKENIIGDYMDIGAKEITLTSDRNNGIVEGNAVHWLSDFSEDNV